MASLIAQDLSCCGIELYLHWHVEYIQRLTHANVLSDAHSLSWTIYLFTADPPHSVIKVTELMDVNGRLQGQPGYENPTMKPGDVLYAINGTYLNTLPERDWVSGVSHHLNHDQLVSVNHLDAL